MLLLKKNWLNFAKEITANNSILTQDLKAQLDDITKYIDSVLDIQAQEIESRHDELFAKNTELLGNQNNISLKISGVENKQDLFASEFNKSISGIVNKLETSHSENLKTMAELSVVTAEQLEDIKTETVNAIGEIQNLSKNQFDILQTTHNSIINSVTQLNTKS